MSDERLWSPWRMAYIRSTRSDEGCIFCDLPAGDADERNLVLGRGRHTFALLNRFPYNPGHLMIAPLRHVGDLGELRAEELGETMAFAQSALAALRAESSPHGFNLGINLGAVAGAGIADHVHLHVVPRWGGDTNFMPVLGQTKVLPELLAETWAKLRPHLQHGPF